VISNRTSDWPVIRLTKRSNNDQILGHGAAIDSDQSPKPCDGLYGSFEAKEGPIFSILKLMTLYILGQKVAVTMPNW
jgi:hypothetical protein